MVFLAGAGVGVDTYRNLHPGLANAIAVEVSKRNEERIKANGEAISAIIEIIGTRLIAIEAVLRAIASRPALF